MSLASALFSFGLRQVFDGAADTITRAVESRLTDHGQALTRALGRAQERSWQALGIALAGDGFVEQVKVLFATGDDRGIREQVAAFLQGNPLPLGSTPASHRQTCLAELKRLRGSGLLADLDPTEIARRTGGLQRHTDLAGLVQGAEQAVSELAEQLAGSYPNLAGFLRMPTPGGPPLLVSAFAYFFRREVETDDELAHGLFFDGLRQLASSQARGFGEVNKALASLGDRFDAVLGSLDRIEATVVQTQTAVLDLQGELQRLAGMQLQSGDEIRSLLVEVLRQLGQVGMNRGEVRPHHSVSIRTEDERRAVRLLLGRIRQLPDEERRQVPALLNGMGKLQIGTGDFEQARKTFGDVLGMVADPAAQAEAAFNLYWAALEQKKWDDALAAIRQAAALDGLRFAPFPLHRYQPRRILGAGGFGTAFLCHDGHFDEEVVVKTLHVADLDRGVDDVFREARILRKLSHPGIIRVQECEYADPTTRNRPYIVMEYFPGRSLGERIREEGPLALPDLLDVARQIAEGMQVAHQQGILHRDLKPDNILVVRTGERWQVKVIDFGLALRRGTIETSQARIVSEDTVLGLSVAGTLEYAPPEQLGERRDVKPGPYSDVYAFGKLCCRALFGTTQLTRRHWTSVPDAVADLLERCIEQEVADRPPSFQAVLDALGALAGGRASTPLPAPGRSPDPQPAAPALVVASTILPALPLPTAPVAPLAGSEVPAPDFDGWDGDPEEIPDEEDRDDLVIYVAIAGALVGVAAGWFVKGLIGALLGGIPGLLIGLPLGFLARRLARSPEGIANGFVVKGIALEREKKPRAAEAAFRCALRRDETCVAAHTRLARLLATCTDATLRDPEKALDHARRACARAGKERTYPQLTLGLVLMRGERYAEAMAILRQTVANDPRSAAAHNLLAWLLATCPEASLRDGVEAMSHASRAADLTGWKKAYVLDTLAACHAEAGQFDRAIEAQQQALERATSNTEDYQSRLNLYRANQPYRMKRNEGLASDEGGR